MLRDPNVKSLEPLWFILFGAEMIGVEVYMRIVRATLAAQPGRVEVFQRGVLKGSFDPARARYWSRRYKLKAVLMGGLGSAVPILVASLIYPHWSRIGMILFGVVSMGAFVRDYTAYWTIEAPKGGKDPVLFTDPVARTMTYQPGVDAGRWTLTLKKADIIALLGFWPGDRKMLE